MRTIRFFLLVEGVTYVVAALIHGGVLVPGYEHFRALIAESVLAVVLLGGLALTGIAPGRTRGIGIVAQAFALAGTLIGLVAIAVGVGPRTVPDVIYHIAIIAVLVWGVVTASHVPSGLERERV